ncbi:MAG: enoyl-CoA hydratase/isomerase family protein [Alphaproteobacteria bacterium]|nr:MAG: enoyl-CoA hydratase/isomerase family protein [Alphaproteobacteria bacterium]
MSGDGSGITLRRDGPVAILTLNRPERRNALDMAAIAGLRDCCAEIEAAEGLRAVILTGTGRAFCAGGDIAAWSALDAETFGRRWIRDGHDAFDALARLRLPVIAVLNGHALGGGLELAACADLRIAETHVKLGQPEPGLGIVPGWSGTQRAVRRFGAQIVRRMVLFGEIFTAEEALAHGLVDLVVETGTGLDAAREVAQAVIARAPCATTISKMMINAAEGEERERVLDALAGTAAAGSAELAEGLAAFREKRKPKFT